MFANEYDYNLYGADQNTMGLTAYRLYLDGQGNVCTDSDRGITLTLTRGEDRVIIRDLVNDDTFYNMHLAGDYTDYDFWLEHEELTLLDKHPKLLEWLNNLPEYRMVDERELNNA
jgi:hypothetical protein